MAPTAVLLLAYGTPETPAQVEPYFTHIRGGRVPSPEAVEHLRRRYELIGGRTHLLDITNETARELERSLDRRAPGAYRTYVAMKHWHPFIADVVVRMAVEGVRQVIAIVLAPHASRLGGGDYGDYLTSALRVLGTPLDLRFVESWHARPEFVRMMSDRVGEGIAAFPADERATVTVLFSAHSLPLRVRNLNTRYEAELLASCTAVAEGAGLRDWRFAWQSAGSTREPWLGPDVRELLESLHAEGVRRVLSVPIGFVCDHLEVLYDIDYEARAMALELGMVLRRTRMPNASPEFIAVLDAVVAEVERGAVTRNPVDAA